MKKNRKKNAICVREKIVSETTVLGILKKKICDGYEMTYKERILFIQFFMACMGLPFDKNLKTERLYIDGTNYWRCDWDYLAKSNDTIVDRVHNFINARWCMEGGYGKNHLFKPLLTCKKVGRCNYYAFNEAPINNILVDDFPGDVRMLFDISESEKIALEEVEKKNRPKKICTSVERIVGRRGKYTKLALEYALSAKSWDGNPVFRHPNLKVKTFIRAISIVDDYFAGCFGKGLRLKPAFFEETCQKRVNGVLDEVREIGGSTPDEALAHFKKCIDNYVTSFIDGNEAAPYKTKSLYQFLTDPFCTGGSLFLYYFRLPADPARTRIDSKMADKFFYSLPDKVMECGIEIWHQLEINREAGAAESLSRQFWKHISHIHARIKDVRKEYGYQLNDFFGIGTTNNEATVLFLTRFMEWLEERGWELKPVHFRLDGKTLPYFIRHIQKEYELDKRVMDEFL